MSGRGDAPEGNRSETSLCHWLPRETVLLLSVYQRLRFFRAAAAVAAQEVEQAGWEPEGLPGFDPWLLLAECRGVTEPWHLTLTAL